MAQDQGITVRDLVSMALKDAGVVSRGLVPAAHEITDAMMKLNFILAQWRTKRLDAWHLIDLGKISTGAQFYTVGKGGDYDVLLEGDFNSPDFNDPDFNVAKGSRIVKIEAAFVRLRAQTGSAAVDIPLTQIPSYEDYANIRLKTQDSLPTHFFYDPAFPLGKVFFWPIPLPSLYEMHILVRQPLLSAASLDTPLNIPEEYFLPLELALARNLRMSYKYPVDPALEAQFKSAMNILKQNNIELPNMRMPAGLTRRGRLYNIFADESY